MKLIIAGAVIIAIIILVAQYLVPLTLVGPEDSTTPIHIYDNSDPYYVAHANTHVELSNTQYEAGQTPTVTEAQLTLALGSHTAPSATDWVVTISGYDYLWYRNGQNANSLLFNSLNAQIGPSGMNEPMALSTTSQQYPAPGDLVAGDHVEVRLVLEMSASGNEGDIEPFEHYEAGYGAEIVEHINLLPIVTATASPQSGYVPLTVQLSGTATDDGAITSYEWDFGDGSNPVTGRLDYTHTYTNTGTFIATFMVVDDEGGTGSDSVTVTVNAGGINPPPTVSASASPTSGQAPLSVSFSASSDDDGTIVSYGWDFGDGDTSSSESPQHTYQVPGTYTAVFSAVDNEGVTASKAVTITVTEAYVPPPDDEDDDDDDDEEGISWLWPSLIIIGAVVLALILWAGGGLIGGVIGIILIILAAIASLLMFLGVI